MKKITLESSLEDFSKKFAKSRELTEKNRGRMPGGFSRRTFNYGPHAVFVEKGEGQYIYTVDGHRLLDLNNNYSVNILGHNNPKVNQAIIDILPRGISFGNPAPEEGQLAEILINRMTGMERVKFSCSASESNMTAVRIARAYTGKSKVAKFEGGYHGFIDFMAISAHPNLGMFPGPDHHPLPVPDSAGIPSFVTENTIVLTQNDLPGTERILRANAKDIACLLVELQSCAGGLVALDQEFVDALRALTKELGIVMIVDETISLRAGYGGLQGVYKVKPDLTVMGKIIGGGIPVGAVGGTAEVMDVVEQDQVMISGTHHGHIIAMAAGIACMNCMDHAAYEKLNAQSMKIQTGINEWAKSKNYPFLVYGKGFSYLGYTFTDRVGREIKTHRDFWYHCDLDRTQAFSLEIANRGYFPVIRGQFCLSTPMTDADIDGFIETSKDIITGIMG